MCMRVLELDHMFIHSSSFTNSDNDRESTRNLCPDYCILVALREQVNKYVNDIQLNNKN